MNRDDQPRLWVFAGPNGAGKSTLVKRHKVVDRLLIINPDEIAYSFHRSYKNDTATIAKAGRVAVEQRKQLIQARQTFGVETTLTGRSELQLMRLSKEYGYKVRLIYVGLDEVEQSNSRVAERVKRGGHEVSEEDILRHFDRSLNNLAPAIQLSNRVRVLDNSGRFCRLLLSVERGQTKFINRNLPEWFKGCVPREL